MQDVSSGCFCFPSLPWSSGPLGGWWQLQVQQCIGKDVPEDSKQHEDGVHGHKDPPQRLVLQPLLIVSENHHAQGNAHGHTTQVCHKAWVRARGISRWVETEPHSPPELHTHCKGRRQRDIIAWSQAWVGRDQAHRLPRIHELIHCHEAKCIIKETRLSQESTGLGDKSSINYIHKAISLRDSGMRQKKRKR